MQLILRSQFRYLKTEVTEKKGYNKAKRDGKRERERESETDIQINANSLLLHSCLPFPVKGLKK